MQPDITRAAPKDAAWIATLWNGIITDTLITFTTTPKTLAEVGDMIAARPVFVLPDQAGFATYGPFRPGPGYAATVEHSVYVQPALRGQGLGAPLLRHLIDHATGARHRVMVAGISGANPGAVRFHQRMGFAQVGHLPEVGYKDEQWLDLILMQKMLNRPDTARDRG